MASGVLNNAFRIIDQYAAGSISTPAQAAIGSSVFPLIATWGLYQWVAGGAGPLIARATGAGDEPLRRKALGNALTGGVVLGVAMAIVGTAGAGAIATVLGL